MQIDFTGANMHKIQRVNKNDLFDRVMKSVADFTSVFADMELDNLPVTELPVEKSQSITAFVGFEGACSGVAWASCSEAFAELIASRLRRTELSNVEDGKRAAMVDMITLLGGDIRLLISPATRDMKLSEISVFKTAEFDCSAITGHPENLRGLFRYVDDHLHVGVMLGKNIRMPNEEKN